jgi:hypothetical protein
MHDIYAYGLGLYTLIATVLLTEFTADKVTVLLRHERRDVKRVLWLAGIRLIKWTYLIITAGIILPLLCGACLDLYVMMPFKRLVAPGSKPEMQIMQDWAFGIIHLKIAGRIIMYLDGRQAQQMRLVPFPSNPLTVDFPGPLDESKYPPSHSQIPHSNFQTWYSGVSDSIGIGVSVSRYSYGSGDATRRR